jgi:hypothetical protein
VTIRTTTPDLLIDHGDGRKVTYPLGASVDLDEARARSLTEPAPERPARA